MGFSSNNVRAPRWLRDSRSPSPRRSPSPPPKRGNLGDEQPALNDADIDAMEVLALRKQYKRLRDQYEELTRKLEQANFMTRDEFDSPR